MIIWAMISANINRGLSMGRGESFPWPRQAQGSFEDLSTLSGPGSLPALNSVGGIWGLKVPAGSSSHNMCAILGLTSSPLRDAMLVLRGLAPKVGQSRLMARRTKTEQNKREQGLSIASLVLRGGAPRAVESRQMARRLMEMERKKRERDLRLKEVRAKGKAEKSEVAEKIRREAEEAGGELGNEFSEDYESGEIVELGKDEPFPYGDRSRPDAYVYPIIESQEFNRSDLTDEELMKYGGPMTWSPLEPLEEKLAQRRVKQFQWGEKVPHPENAMEDLTCLEQWMGEDAVEEMRQRQVASFTRGQINITARVEEIWANLTNNGKDEPPQRGVLMAMCEQVALKEQGENVKKEFQNDLEESDPSNDLGQEDDLLDVCIENDGKKLSKSRLDERGRPLPPGWERVKPLPLGKAYDYLVQNPDVLKNIDDHMWDHRNIVSQAEVDVEIARLQVCALQMYVLPVQSAVNSKMSPFFLCPHV